MTQTASKKYWNYNFVGTIIGITSLLLNPHPLRIAFAILVRWVSQSCNRQALLAHSWAKGSPYPLRGRGILDNITAQEVLGLCASKSSTAFCGEISEQKIGEVGQSPGGVGYKLCANKYIITKIFFLPKSCGIGKKSLTLHAIFPYRAQEQAVTHR